ncbi:MAG: rod shape-determining protein MreC [Saprospiraceae bacterium]|nr:rod shape-determining protein MreC [Saprospiraceae bacterium]
MLDFFGNVARYGTFFTFLLLEIICFSLVVRYNKSQQEILLHSGNLFSGKVLQAYNSGTNYLHLADVADSLALENAILIERTSLENDPPILVFKDTIDLVLDSNATSIFEIIPAKVINNSVNKFHNFLTLDKGEEAGLEPGMGVVTPVGLVGIVRNVSKHYARVMSVLHRQNRVSVAVQRSGFFGTLVWKGNDPLTATVEDIPKHADLQVGDTLITSGFSSIFPKGLPVGVITDFELASGSNSYSVNMKLGQDLSNLKYCYVVKNIRREELEAIEQSVENE